MIRPTAVLALPCALALAACGSKPQASDPVAPVAAKAETTATAMPAPAATIPDAKPVAIDRNSDALEFHYAWPAAAAAIPALDAWLRADLESAFKQARKDAVEDRLLSNRDKRDWHAHESSLEWDVAGQSPQLLSLVGAISSFTGGAHPNHGSHAMLWDKKTDREIKFAGLFPPGVFDRLARPAWCRGIAAAQAKRREGEPVSDTFDQCPALADLTIAPVDADKDGLFDTIDFIADPYVAGPYAEGDYEVPVAVTARLIDALDPAYRPGFEIQGRQ